MSMTTSCLSFDLIDFSLFSIGGGVDGLSRFGLLPSPIIGLKGVVLLPSDNMFGFREPGNLESGTTETVAE